MKKYVFIYTLEDPITNEIRYVGKTNNLKVRYSNHLVEKAKCHRKNWIKSLKNKGLKPIMKVLDAVPEKEWQFWEIFYISLLKTWGFSLVNGSAGGMGNNGIKLPTVSVKCYTKEGVLIKSFDSVKNAAKEYGCSSGNIVSACRGIVKTIKNMVWRYSNDPFTKFEMINRKCTPILQLDYFTNEIIAEYSSISQASKELNCKAPTISRVLRGERKKYKNTYFKYKDIV